MSDLEPRFDPWEQTKPLERTSGENGELLRWQHVRLHPHSGGDILDMALAGRTAVIEAIEQDFGDQIHIAVILDDDPGRDLGALRQPGHRFFFKLSEVEPLDG